MWMQFAAVQGPPWLRFRRWWTDWAGAMQQISQTPSERS
ncbi:hypothetical protein L3Y19_gp069 [Gordonia phage Neville]|uniref:Uncharacterized protein n=1 Tax=Gordonia phage Neville TaxID=2301693 RepID=A0A385E095_9CAUD|nr:hypothetical protein L3Y19_gp069 [Gordonia phage Neville]AXQ64438.1 hypothetical protein SEA_NEVILLE_69 [Gordonia phage Neville]